MEKLCKTCNNTQDIIEFRIMTEKRTKIPTQYYSSVCKSCERKLSLERYQKNREKLIEKNKQYKANNKDKVNKTRREYTKSLLSSDPIERVKRNMKSLISLKIKKTRHTGDYLGADMETIVKWFEFNFTSEMSWDNYGSYWQIDHVIPISLFDLTSDSEMSIAFCWMNLMPLEKMTNNKKSNKICSFRVFHQERQLRLFTKQYVHLQHDINSYLVKYAVKCHSCLQHA